MKDDIKFQQHKLIKEVLQQREDGKESWKIYKLYR